MSRPKRILRKNFVVFCEGDTEYNYIDKMRCKQGVHISIHPINMGGGGYSSFLHSVKTESMTNCLAKFIIIDADRMKKHPGEIPKFKELFEYCKIQNQKKSVPIFLILDNPDFEFIACLHDPEYKNQNPELYIKKKYGYSSLEQFKKEKNVYALLNTTPCSYETMLERAKRLPKIIMNKYICKKASFEIQITDSKSDLDRMAVKGSNIDEFFEMIDW